MADNTSSRTAWLLLQLMKTVVKSKYRTWRICINPIHFTLKVSNSKTLNHNIKQKSSRVSNNRTVILQLFNFKRLLTKSSQKEAVNQSSKQCNLHPPLMRTMLNMSSLALRTILYHNQLKSVKCNITQWAATISVPCYTAPTNRLTKSTKTKTKMKIKKAIR